MQIYKPNYMNICIQYSQKQINKPIIESKINETVGINKNLKQKLNVFKKLKSS